MKQKITQKLIFMILLLLASLGYSQKVAVIGLNHAGTDGFTFLVTQDLALNEVIYFTENEYDDALNRFTDQTESVVVFTAGSAILKGNVVFVNETATDTFTVTCTSGVCGTAVKTAGSGNFALATDGDALYAYTDADTDPTNAITAVYSVLYAGTTEPSIVNGGFIPTSMDPSLDHPTAIVIDGFPVAQPGRVEFTPTTPARTNVTKVMLENPSNYVHALANQALSTLFFTNFNLTTSTPIVTVTAAPASVNENSGTGMVYTFSLSTNAVTNLTINFSVGGTATFTTDYTQTGAASYTASVGSVTILSGSNSATVTVTPVGDTTLEANETIVLTLTSGTGYSAGSPGAATTTITNDDTLVITPIVAVTGLNQSGSDGFSFVALQNITAGTVVYFTENPFNTSTLNFSGTEGVMSWTAPAGGLARGQVVVATSAAPNIFATTCSSGTCGSVTVVSGTFSLGSVGEELYAYLDTDSNHLNGVTSVQAVLYTGSSLASGGTIPTLQDPGIMYPGAVVVDGFPAVSPVRTEYNPALRGVTVDRANFQNPANWLHAQPSATLSATPFANIIISTGSPNPFATVTVLPSGVLENSGTAMVYTFALSSPSVGATVINFTVGGSATFTTDYTTTGATTFTAGSGSVTIANGASTATVQVTPVGDTTLEVQESVVLTITTGTGYDGGSPNAASGFINNDDVSYTAPLAVIVGLSHTDPDAISFVAAQDIPANTVLYFTDNTFNNSTLLFGSGEAVIRWTSPASVILKGNVMVMTESSPDTFTVTCSGSGCGTVTLLSGNFAMASAGEGLYIYSDSDTNPSNGVTTIYSVLYTGTSAVSGGIIPALENPATVYIGALVVDGFPAVAPLKTQYDPTKRGVLVTNVNFEDISNWVHAQTPPALSTVPFALLSLGGGSPVLTAASQTNVSCFGGSNGAASVNPATGGIGPYTYNWTPGNPTGDGTVSVTGLTQGTWTCTVTDFIGGTANVVFTITQPTAALAATIASQTNVSCFGGSNGAASVNVTGGTTNYSYNWTPGNPTGDGTASVTSLTQGTWTCTITDANGCTTSRIFTITQPTAALAATIASQTNVSCFGGSNGAASVNVTGGTTNYSYNWTPGNPTGDGTASVTGLTQGTWTCTITDANGCTTSQVFTITQPTAALAATIASQTNVSCFGGSNGAASVNVTGGTTNYSYNWTPGNPTGDGTASVTGLTQGTWTCTITDANGCTTSQVFTITQPTAALAASIASQTNVSCFGGSNGAASVNVTGGTPNYSYNWTPGNPTGDGTASVTGLTQGTWTCTITDANGCTTSQVFTITEPAAINATVSLAGGTLTANQAGAGYQWYLCPNTIIPTAQSQSYTPTVNGDYKVVITVGGCSVTSACSTVLGNLSFETSEVFVVYPNPSNGLINIEANFEGDFQLVNQLGQKIKDFRVLSAIVNEIDLGNLSNGIYYIIGVNGTSMRSHKLIIKQ